MSSLLRLRLLEYLEVALQLQGMAHRLSCWAPVSGYKSDIPDLVLLWSVEAEHVNEQARIVIRDVYYRLKMSPVLWSRW